MRYRTHITLAFLTFSSISQATTWSVGPGQTYTLPSQVSTLVGDGDTVNIEAGVYASDVAGWTADDLLIRGIGGMAHLESNGLAYQAKAIWVIQGDRTTVEWIGFSECAVPDHNGAGIRQEGLDLTVRRCLFHDNENGILAGELHPSTIRIEYSEFDHNGFGDGFSHNLYIGNIDSLIFRFNYSHHAFEGHELKSRAQVNVIEYNRIGNEALGEASREIDLPDGGQAYIIGNVIQQGILSQNSNMVGFGLESLDNPGPHEFYAINNTLVNERPSGSFFSVAESIALFKAYNNILAGAGFFLAGTWPAGSDTVANVRNSSIAALQFADAANYDYHIALSSPANGTGFPAGLSTNGYPLVAWYEYVHPADGILRCQQALLDVGAFETCTTGLDELHGDQLQLYPNPACDHLRVMVNGGALIQRVDVIDAWGRVRQHSISNGTSAALLDLCHMPAGLSHVRVTTSAGVLVRAFVRQ